MITLIRMCILKYLKVKWELAIWQAINQQANELIKHPENIEKKLLPFIAETVHKAVEFENYKNKTGTFVEK